MATAQATLDAIAGALDMSVSLMLESLKYIADKIRVEILALKKKVYDGISAWLNTNYQGLKTLLVVFVGSLVVVGVAALVFLVSKRAAVSVGLKGLQTLDTLSKVKISLALIRGINAVAVQVSDQWRAFVGAMTSTWEVIADTLGVPLAFVTSFFAAWQGMIYSAFMSVGIDPTQAGFAWAQGVNDFLTQVNKRFRDFAANPGSILVYISAWFEEQWAKGVSNTTMGALETIEANLEAIAELNRGIDGIQAGFDGMIAALPDQIEDSFRENAAPILGPINQTIDEIQGHVATIVDEVIPTVQEMIEDTREILKSRMDLIASAAADGFDQLREAWIAGVVDDAVLVSLFGTVPENRLYEGQVSRPATVRLPVLDDVPSPDDPNDWEVGAPSATFGESGRWQV